MHPNVLAKYKENDYEYNIDLHPNDKNEVNFFQKTKIAKKPVIHKIIKIVRTKVHGAEHVYYHETLRSRDYLNNPIDHTRVVGKYEDPQFVLNIDPRTNTPRASEVQGFETVYEFPWTPNIVDQWLAQPDFELDDNCGFIVIEGSKKYGAYNQEQFCNDSFEELVTFGKFGTKNPEQIQEVKKQIARQTQKPSG